MKKSTNTARNGHFEAEVPEYLPDWVNRVKCYQQLKGDWIPFNQENPNLEAGVYWAVGQRQDERFGMPGLHPFQILIEVLEGNHELSIIPTAAVEWPVFQDCLPHVTHVSQVYAPIHPYTGTQIHGEYA